MQASELLAHLLKVLVSADSAIARLELSLAPCCHSLALFGAGLEQVCHLTHLSFRGSLMGPAPLQLLKDGLAANRSIEDLDLSGCDLTDQAAGLIGGIIKARSRRCAHNGAAAGVGPKPAPGSAVLGALSAWPTWLDFRSRILKFASAKATRHVCRVCLVFVLLPSCTPRGGPSR